MAAQTVIDRIKQLSLSKRSKYYEALKYALLNYRIDDRIRVKKGGRSMPVMSTRSFHDNYQPEYGDLIYGIHGSRSHGMYKYIDGNSVWGKDHHYCDQFNNHIGVGTGANTNHFKEHHNDYFFRVYRFNNAIKTASQTNPPERMGAFFDLLVGSRFAPEGAYNASEAELKNNYIKSTDKLVDVKQRLAIRRACKAGILAVATQKAFTESVARIHFILDGLGDLSDIALKRKRGAEKTYLPITSSELTFCFRKWWLPPINLFRIVQFYVNAKEVPAPWVENWEKRDATGKMVKSGYYAWHRYSIYRDLLRAPLGLTKDLEDMIRPGMPGGIL